MPIYPRDKKNGNKVYDIYVSMPYGRLCRRGLTEELAQQVEAALILEKAWYKASKITGIQGGLCIP